MEARWAHAVALPPPPSGEHLNSVQERGRGLNLTKGLDGGQSWDWTG